MRNDTETAGSAERSDDVHFGGNLESTRPWEKKCDVGARGEEWWWGVKWHLYARTHGLEIVQYLSSVGSSL